MDSIEKDGLIAIISSLVGEYQIEHTINWYKFASSLGTVNRNYSDGIEYMKVYCEEKNMAIRVIANQGRHTHVWTRGNFDMKFRFYSDDEHAPTINDYELAIQYFEKKYKESLEKSYEEDPILKKMSVELRLIVGFPNLIV